MQTGEAVPVSPSQRGVRGRVGGSVGQGLQSGGCGARCYRAAAIINALSGVFHHGLV